MSDCKIGILGAGAIGCYVGGRLATAGEDVVFIGRPRLKDELLRSGLVLTDLEGGDVSVPKEKLAFSTELTALADRDVILFCVKSAQTAEVAAELAGILGKGAIVVSLQNGLRNPEVLRAELPGRLVLAGIVGFNVVWRGVGRLLRATSGPLVVEASADPRVKTLTRLLSTCGFTVELPADIRPLQWTKLILNLNNAVSALTDAPTPDLVFVPGYRRVLLALMTEALAVLRAAGIRTARLGAPIPVRFLPLMLRLPTPLLRLVARVQIKIDREARSSMWDDLTKGRATEVDYLNGEIVRLAESCGAAAPLNRRMVELVHEAEARKSGSPKLSASALWEALSRPPR
jgi:2-dehydropantoate 2-reductase